MQAVLTVSKRRLEFLKERPVLKRPLELMQKKERVLAEQERLLYKETAGQLQRLSRGLLAAEGRLAAVSPFSVMNRGYAMLMDEGGTPLTTAPGGKSRTGGTDSHEGRHFAGRGDRKGGICRWRERNKPLMKQWNA